MEPQDISLETARAILGDIEASLTEVGQEIEETNQQALQTLLHVENRVDVAAEQIEQLIEEVVVAEQETEDALDSLILEQIDDATTDEEKI